MIDSQTAFTNQHLKGLQMTQADIIAFLKTAETTANSALALLQKLETSITANNGSVSPELAAEVSAFTSANSALQSAVDAENTVLNPVSPTEPVNPVTPTPTTEG
jgi:hypothetical protein